MTPTQVDTVTPADAANRDAPRGQRSDARRNVVALLGAAKTVFAQTGVDAPAKEITDLAGVGIGTLYRHFPRRSDLVVAVMQHEIDACADAATRLSSERDPWDALVEWIGRLTELIATKRGLATALHSGDPAFDDLPRYIMEKLEPALNDLLGAARSSGDVTVDLTATDVILTIALMCQPVRGTGLDYNRRVIAVFLNGLRGN
jgi:AcrR family transcriptional regulator